MLLGVPLFAIGGPVDIWWGGGAIRLPNNKIPMESTIPVLAAAAEYLLETDLIDDLGNGSEAALQILQEADLPPVAAAHLAVALHALEQAQLNLREAVRCL